MNETREIQSVILEIFKVVSDICESHEIPYFAIGGTCLGAVRHKGFIPWDDDLDIAIPIEDYERFMQIAKEELPSHLELYVPSTSKHNNLSFIKVLDNRTTYIENVNVPWKDTYKGVWVDIMPISGVPATDKGKKKFRMGNRLFNGLFYKTKNGFPHNGSLEGKIFWFVVYPLRLLPPDFIWKRWLKWLHKHPFKTAEWTGYVWSQKINKLIFPKKWFDDFVYLDFEDTKMRCPKDYHEFLNQMFGNYMEYPPEDQRTSGHKHDKGVVDLKHSYKDYQSGKLPLPEYISSGIE